MKKIGILFLILVGLAFLNSSCSNEEIQNETPKTNLIKKTAKEFGVRHNEGLDYIYKQLTENGKLKSLSGDESDLKKSVLIYTNRFIDKESGIATKSTAGKEYFTVEDYDKYTLEYIKNQMSERELYYVEQVINDMDNLINGKSYEYLLDEVINDKQLNDNQKTAVCVFICTAENSAEYWNENYDLWQELKGNEPRLKMSAKAERVLFADCYWGWFGFLSSGCNPIVGAGGAVAGSALSAL